MVVESNPRFPSRCPLAVLALLCALPALPACGDDSLGDADFTSNVADAYATCRESEITFLIGKHGMQKAFAPCGSNNFGTFSWSPDGIHLYFQVTHAGHILNGEDKTIATVPTPLPVTNAVWMDASRLLALLPQPEEAITGQRVGQYDIRKATLQAVDCDLDQPSQLQPGPDAQHVYVLALDEQGQRRPFLLDVTTGQAQRALTWIEEPVETFTYEPTANLVTWGVGEQVHIAAPDGSARVDLPDARRAVVRPEGRYVLLERLGAPVSNFDQKTWDELSPEARERAERRRDAWVEQLPDWAERETMPPSIDLYDMESGHRYRFTEFQGDEFEWYHAKTNWCSFRLWGIEEKELNENIVLVNLTDRMRMLDRGIYPTGIELVGAVPDVKAGASAEPAMEPPAAE